MFKIHALRICYLAVPVFGAMLFLPGCGADGVSEPAKDGNKPEVVAALQQNRAAMERNQMPPWKRPRVHH
jgi:hypothetical protein